MSNMQVSDAALGNRVNPYESVWRSLFWLGLGLFAVSILVYAADVFCAYKRWNMPIILTAPRPQITLLMFGVTAIAQSSAGPPPHLSFSRPSFLGLLKLCREPKNVPEYSF